MSELDDIAAALLALPPGEFTAARDARAKAEADRDLARGVKALRRPSVAAWVVDAFARDRPDSVHRMLDLAESLRAANDELDGAELRALSTQRRALVARLAEDAVGVAEAAGVRVGPSAREEIERTLTAAMLDEAAGRAVASGRLVRALEAVGLEGVDLAGALAGGEVPPAPARASRDHLAERRACKAAERAVRDAEQEASEAERELRRREALAAAANDRVAHLEERVADLHRDLARLAREVEVAHEDARAATEHRAAAERLVAEAAERAAQARSTLG